MEELVRDGQVWDVFGKELPSDSESGCGTRRKQDGRATHGLGIRKKQQSIKVWLIIHFEISADTRVGSLSLRTPERPRGRAGHGRLFCDCHLTLQCPPMLHILLPRGFHT